MRPAVHRGGWVAFAVTALVAGDHLDATADQGISGFTLALSGNAAAHVVVSCEVERPTGAATETFSGKPPIRRTFEGQSLVCRIHQTVADGRVDVYLSSTTGNDSQLSTAGAGSRIQISVR